MTVPNTSVPTFPDDYGLQTGSGLRLPFQAGETRSHSTDPFDNQSGQNPFLDEDRCHNLCVLENKTLVQCRC